MKIREEYREEDWGMLGDYSPGDVVEFRSKSIPGYYMVVHKLDCFDRGSYSAITVVNIVTGKLRVTKLDNICKEVKGEFVITGEYDD